MKKEPASILTQAKREGWPCQFYDFRKAKIEGVDYYNPSLLRRPDGLWLITRKSMQRHDLTYGFNSLMAFKLDDNHLPQFGIPIHVPHSSSNEHFEDPRVCLSPNGRYLLSACNFIVYGLYWTGAHQVLLEINEEWKTMRRHDPVYGNNGSTVKNNKGDEKNWLWFFHDGELHMVYMTDPHTVVRFDQHSFAPVQQWTTQQMHPDWTCGHIRGGTAPVRVGDLYFSFFHSSLQWRTDGKRRYFMGAYTFEASPPFRMLSMTPKPLLTGSQLDPWAEGKPLVVFPCSAIMENDTWTVSLGVNDLVSAYVKIPHEDLLERLDPGVVFRAAPRDRDKTPLETVFK